MFVQYARSTMDLRATHPTKASIVLTQGGSLVLINDHWSVNENSQVVLKIHMVEFEIWLGKWQNTLSIGLGIQAYKK